MGTNVYAYLRSPKEIKSAACAKIEQLAKEGKFDDLVEYIEITKDELNKNEIHIGKRSGGWQFNFDHNEWKYYDFTKESIMNFLKLCSTIADEYGREYTLKNFGKSSLIQ